MTRKPRAIIKLVLVVYCAFCVVTLFRLKLELNDLSREYTEVKASVEESEAYVRRLKNRLAADFDDEYVEGVAEEKLGLVLPDEVVFYNDLAD